MEEVVLNECINNTAPADDNLNKDPLSIDGGSGNVNSTPEAGSDVVMNDEVSIMKEIEINGNANNIDQENENPCQKPEEFTPEEAALFQQLFGSGKQKVQFVRLHCTACNEHLGSAPNMQYNRYVHPLLQVLQCKKCFDFYTSGEFEKDEDGSELYCRWCGQGGKVLCCASCCFVFCQRCIRMNVGKQALNNIKNSDDWTCFSCKPEQIIKPRVICKALYNFTQSEIKIANETNQPHRLRMDHSLCCKEKPLKPPGQEKRKQGNAFDYLGNEDSNEEVPKKKKRSKTNVLLQGTNKNQRKEAFSAPDSAIVWESQTQDEVVCTPDLAILMDDDEPSPQPPSTSPPPLVPSSSMAVPQLVALASATNSQLKKPTTVQFITQANLNAPIIRTTPMVMVPTTNLVTTPVTLDYRLPLLMSKPPITIASASKPIMPDFVNLQEPSVKFQNKPSDVQPIMRVAHNQNSSIINTTPARLAPGLRYEWFEKATQLTSRVNQNLSARLCSLSKEQYNVTSLEGLASIHNNLQEILSNSINSLMQIRKSLRSDFIAGLKKLKFCKNPNLEDRDVVVVDSTTSSTNTTQTPSINTTSTKPGFIKVKPVSELFDSSAISIKAKTSNKNVVPRLSILKPVHSKNTASPVKRNTNVILNGLLNSSHSVINEPVTQVFNNVDNVAKPIGNGSNGNSNIPRVYGSQKTQLKKKSDSKFDEILNANLKCKPPPGITPMQLKQMLSVRVVVDSNFGKSTPRSKPRKDYKPMNTQGFELKETSSNATTSNKTNEYTQDSEKAIDVVQLLSDEEPIETTSEVSKTINDTNQENFHVQENEKNNAQENGTTKETEQDKSDVQEKSQKNKTITESEQEKSNVEDNVQKNKVTKQAEQDKSDVQEKTQKNKTITESEQEKSDVEDNVQKNKVTKQTEQDKSDVQEKTQKNKTITESEQEKSDVEDIVQKNKITKQAEQDKSDVQEKTQKNKTITESEQEKSDVENNVIKQTEQDKSDVEEKTQKNKTIIESEQEKSDVEGNVQKNKITKQAEQEKSDDHETTQRKKNTIEAEREKSPVQENEQKSTEDKDEREAMLTDQELVNGDSAIHKDAQDVTSQTASNKDSNIESKDNAKSVDQQDLSETHNLQKSTQSQPNTELKGVETKSNFEVNSLLDESDDSLQSSTNNSDTDDNSITSLESPVQKDPLEDSDDSTVLKTTLVEETTETELSQKSRNSENRCETALPDNDIIDT